METNNLSNKQYYQLISFATRTRSYIIPDELPLIKLMERCVIYCLQPRFSNCDYSIGFIRDLDRMISGYYPFGYKENSGFYGDQYKHIKCLRKVRYSTNIFQEKYKPIEKVLFIKTLRVTYRFILSKHTDSDKLELLQTLDIIRNLAIK